MYTNVFSSMKILITGAASGIGLACSKYYAVHDVTAIDKNDVDFVEASNITKFINENNDFDVMIHSAGLREIEPPHKLSFDTGQKVLNVNLTSSFLLSQGLIKQALSSKRSLCIINMASVSG